MAKTFQPSFRLDLEGMSRNTLQAAAMNEITAIENKIPQGADRATIQESIETAKGTYWKQKQELARRHRLALEEVKAKYQQNVNRYPEREMLRLRQAEMKVNAMTPVEREKYVEEIAAGSKVPSNHYEAQLIRQYAGDNVDLFDRTVQENRIDQPWIDTPEARQVADQLDQIEAIKGSNVEVGGVQMDIEQLVDTQLELERPA